MKSVYELDFPDLFRFIEEDKLPIKYFPEKRLFALHLDTDAPIYQDIQYCPWTGKRLPNSLVNEYIALLDSMGLSVLEPESLPTNLRNEQWWIDRGL